MTKRKSAHAPLVLYNESLPLEMAVNQLDLERLRRGFAELFDRAAQAVQLAEYEQDDAVFERYLVCRTPGGVEITVPADWLADRERLVEHLASKLSNAIGGMGSPSDVRVIKIKVIAVLEDGG